MQDIKIFTFMARGFVGGLVMALTKLRNVRLGQLSDGWPCLGRETTSVCKHAPRPTQSFLPQQGDKRILVKVWRCFAAEAQQAWHHSTCG